MALDHMLKLYLALPERLFKNVIKVLEVFLCSGIQKNINSDKECVIDYIAVYKV